MHARVGESLLALVRASGTTSVTIVGTGKNAGKTVSLRALYTACHGAGEACGLMSIGRDGEAADISDALPKPRLWLQPGTVFATSREILAGAPACEILATPEIATSVGPLVIARVRQGALYELIGPPSASTVRATAELLRQHVSWTIVDGAVDRLAALSHRPGAVIVACGLDDRQSMEDAVLEARGLIARLRLPQHDGTDAHRVEGALTARIASDLVRSATRKPVVVTDAAHVLVSGNAALALLAKLDVRVENALQVVAATVNPTGRNAYADPSAFLDAVGNATGLPTFDVFASERAA